MKRISQKFNPRNKRSVKNLNQVLAYLSGDESLLETNRIASMNTSTIKVINRVARGARITRGQLNQEVIDKINTAYINKKYSDKTYIKELQHRLITLSQKNVLKSKVDVQDLRSTTIGESSKTCLKEFQKKYQLKATGLMDTLTEEKLESVYTSYTGTKPQPKKQFRLVKDDQLKRVVNKIRINSTSQQVYDLQKALVALGYVVSKDEASEHRYGTSTKKAIDEFQAKHGLSVTGQVDKETARVLNEVLRGDHSDLLSDHKIRVRGSVRDESWLGIGGASIKVSEQRIGGGLTIVGEGTTYPNGFYIVSFEPRKRRENEALNLVVEIKKGRQVFMVKEFLDVKQSLWVNYTKGEAKYLGLSDFELISKAINKALGNSSLRISNLEESDRKHDIKYLSKETGIEMLELMKYFIAHRLADLIDDDVLNPAVFYGFIKQNAFGLTGEDLRPQTPSLWSSWLSELEGELLKSILMMNEVEHESVLKSSFDNNLIPRHLMYQ